MASQVRLVELQPAGKLLSLPAIPDELHDGEELLVAATLLPFPHHRHEKEAEPHHHPVHHTRQVDVHEQEHNFLPWLNAAVRYSRI